MFAFLDQFDLFIWSTNVYIFSSLTAVWQTQLRSFIGSLSISTTLLYLVYII
ncbi:hypothetical protein ACB092_08G110000 [Castanea dentata]